MLIDEDKGLWRLVGFLEIFLSGVAHYEIRKETSRGFEGVAVINGGWFSFWSDTRDLTLIIEHYSDRPGLLSAYRLAGAEYYAAHNLPGSGAFWHVWAHSDHDLKGRVAFGHRAGILELFERFKELSKDPA